MNSGEGYKTKAIVLHTMQHKDSGYIVYALTEAFGRVSYYVNSAKRGVPMLGGSKIMLHPLTVIDIVAVKGRGAFHRIKEAKRIIFPVSLFSDVYKSSIALFLSEFMYKVVRDDGANVMLFDYVFHSVKMLEAMGVEKVNFHLYFIVHLTKYLGFFPNNNYQEGAFLDMKSGDFVIIRPAHMRVVDREESKLLSLFMNAAVGEIGEIKSSGRNRSRLLEDMVQYVSLHHDTNYKLKSLEYFKEIF